MSENNEQKADIKCPSCKTYRYPSDFLNDKNRTLKTCKNCREYAKKSRDKNKCPHKRQRSTCKECGGSQICEHGKQKSTCKECGGSEICEHKRVRSTCKECGGGGICEHKRRRSRCKECGGGSICEHKRQRATCKECGGGSICEHKRERSTCKECDIIGYIANITRNRIQSALNGNKELHTVEYLGCTIAEFKAHIEKQFKEGMTWDNHGEWHIDHIIPLKYEKPSLEEVILRLHWENTQPLWASENIAKGNRYIG